MWDLSTSKGKLGPTLKRVKAANSNCIAVYNDNIFKLHSKFYLSNNFLLLLHLFELHCYYGSNSFRWNIIL